MSTTVEHNKALVGGLTKDTKTVVTIAEDSNLRVWDLTRNKQDLLSKTEEGLLTPMTYVS